MVDPVKNFAKVTVSIPYDDTATSILLESGDGAKLPYPLTDGSFNLVWWNVTDYSDPSDDPSKEIVRCTARSSDTLTITRGQEDTSATNKNNIGKIYKMILSMTAKMIPDIQSDAQSKVDTHAALTSSVHNFDASGNAPSQIHDNTKHSESYITSADTGYYRPIWQKQGTAVAGTWDWYLDGNNTDYATITGDSKGRFENLTQNDLDEYKWPNIFLPAGNYKITYVHLTGWNRAKVEFLFGATSLALIDNYTASTVYNVTTTITFTIPTSTTADLRFRSNGKNASSGSYVADFSRLQIEKTG